MNLLQKHGCFGAESSIIFYYIAIAYLLKMLNAVEVVYNFSKTGTGFF